MESGQTEKWLDYAAHSLQNIGQALQPSELLDTCKQAKRAYKLNKEEPMQTDRRTDGLTDRQTARFCCSQPSGLWSGDPTTVETR